MLSEFIRSISDLAVNASNPVIRVGDLRKVLIRDKSGEQVLHDLPPIPRGGILRTIDDVANFVSKACVGSSGRPEIYVDSDAIRILVDSDVRDAVVGIPLEKSETFTAVLGLATDSKPMSPRDAVKFLRFCITPSPGSDRLRSALSRIDFQRKADGTNVTEHGRESYGKSIAAKVQNIDEIPEAIEVTVPVFGGPLRKNSAFDVVLGVYIDVEREAIMIRPLAGELDRAMDKALNSIVESISFCLETDADGRPIADVYRGRPADPIR